jgi:hypothetical protein
MRRLLVHVRRQAVGYVALMVALGGTSYAAFGLPNHSIDPVKLNPHSIGGYVRAWASVNSNGRVTASGGGVRVLVDSGVAPGHYIIDWHPRPSTGCAAIGNVDLRGTGGPSIPGYLVTQAGASRVRGEQSTLQTYNAQGLPTALAFDVELVCSTPR